MPGLLATRRHAILASPEYPLVTCGRQPGDQVLHSISQFAGIELRRSASLNISAGLIGESAHRILGV